MFGSESKAAAIYRLEAIQPCRLKIGDNFVVCNGGGRTVDLICYRITQIFPLKFEESRVGRQWRSLR